MTHINITWEQIEDGVTKLAADIKKTGTQFDSIIGISKGGLIPATMLAELLEIKTLISFGIRSYTGYESGKPVVYQPFPESYNTDQSKSVLIVDDLADTGKTFEDTMQAFSCHQSRADTQIITAALYWKPHTSHVPWHFVRQYKDDTWLVFPWERLSIYPWDRAEVPEL